MAKSFKFACRGLVKVFRSGQNFRVQVLAAFLVLAAAAFFQVAVWQWVVLILLAVLILILEMLNTVFELLVDMLKPRVHEYAGDIKNIMAAMVLIAAISAIIIAGLIFLPYIID